MSCITFFNLAMAVSPLMIMILIMTSFLFSSLPIIVSSCRTSCGDIPIQYPFGIDDGCGSPFYRHLLVCSTTGHLHLRTPSGQYPVRRISYSDPHLLVSDPFMWGCQDGENFKRTRPFSLDTSTHFSLSSQNDYLFFNCSEENVIVSPRPLFCEHFPDRCDSSCDSSSYLCRHLPECGPSALGRSSCCSYYPKTAESLRLMLKYCSSYTSVHWKNSGEGTPYDAGDETAAPEYGVRIDFDLEVTSSCLLCEDAANGGGRCGFDTRNQSFVCLCGEGEGNDHVYNATTYCKDPKYYSQQHNGRKIGISTTVILGAISIVGAMMVVLGIGGFCLWKVRSHKPVTHGLQTNENRLF